MCGWSCPRRSQRLVDPERRLLVTNLMRMANGIQLIPRADYDAMPDKAGSACGSH